MLETQQGQKNSYRCGKDLRRLHESRKGRLKLTKEMMKTVEDTIKPLVKDYNDRQDAIQEALVYILEAKEGQTESYYIQGARFRARDWLRKERRIRSGFLEIESQEVHHADL
jgi:DNA-directed RNA polymerase specialized sigma24 family protein